MPKRYANALIAQNGACNPLRLISDLLEAAQEVRAETGHTYPIREDAAVRLIAHQLAYLLDLSEFDRPLDGPSDPYLKAMREVEEANHG